MALFFEYVSRPLWSWVTGQIFKLKCISQWLEVATWQLLVPGKISRESRKEKQYICINVFYNDVDNYSNNYQKNYLQEQQHKVQYMYILKLNKNTITRTSLRLSHWNQSDSDLQKAPHWGSSLRSNCWCCINNSNDWMNNFSPNSDRDRVEFILCCFVTLWYRELENRVPSLQAMDRPWSHLVCIPCSHNLVNFVLCDKKGFWD